MQSVPDQVERPSHVELEQAFEKSFVREPVSYSWGFFAYDDAPGVTGGGAGNFSWFESKQELFAFLTKFPLLVHSADAEDNERFVKAQKFLAALTPEEFDQTAVDELNKILSGVEQIQWLGQLEDLMCRETEFAQGMRKFFSGSTDALKKTRIPEFVVFLRNWGH